MSSSNLLEGSGPLLWIQAKPRVREYQLLRGEAPLGELKFNARIGSSVSAKVAGQSWSFERKEFWRRVVRAYAENSSFEEASYRPRWNGGGTVTLANGDQLRWRCTNYWKGEWCFLRPEGAPLLRFHNKKLLWKLRVDVEVDPICGSLPYAPLLVAFGWYLLLLAIFDA